MHNLDDQKAKKEGDYKKEVDPTQSKIEEGEDTL